MLLLDADVLAYRAAWSVQYKHYTHPAVGTYRRKRELMAVLSSNFDQDDAEDIKAGLVVTDQLEPVESAYYNLEAMIKTAKRITGCDITTSYLSGSNNFRKELEYPVVYKGNRGAKPVYHKAMVNYLLDNHAAIKDEGFEADDLTAEYARHNRGSCIICSIDKDLKQVPGFYYDFVLQKTVEVLEAEANRSFWRQMITGDRVDNIIGLPNYGPAAAKKLIPDSMVSLEEMRKVVREEYHKNFLGEEGDKMFSTTYKLLWVGTTRPTDENIFG